MGDWRSVKRFLQFFWIQNSPAARGRAYSDLVRPEAVITRHDPAAWLLVRGPDASEFLQGQFTNDLRRNEPHPVTYGLWLNHKGRVLADSFVARRDGGEFAVFSVSSPASVVRERLESYIIADDVTVEDATAGAAGWCLAGEGAADVLRALGCRPLPGVGVFVEQEGMILFAARWSRGPNWWLLTAGETTRLWADRLAGACAAGQARELPVERLQFGRVRAGLPEIPLELGPGDLPNEGGLEHEAISFTKGCYLGQEVMARLNSMGAVRRRLFVVRARSGDELPPRGTALLVGAKRVGELRGVFSGEGEVVGLAMLQKDGVQPGDELQTENPRSAWEVLQLAEGRAW